MPLDCTVCETARMNEEPARREGQACPFCGGVLIPLGAAWRCGRCGFALCVGCEPIGPAGTLDAD